MCGGPGQWSCRRSWREGTRGRFPQGTAPAPIREGLIPQNVPGTRRLHHGGLQSLAASRNQSPPTTPSRPDNGCPSAAFPPGTPFALHGRAGPSQRGGDPVNPISHRRGDALDAIVGLSGDGDGRSGRGRQLRDVCVLQPIGREPSGSPECGARAGHDVRHGGDIHLDRGHPRHTAGPPSTSRPMPRLDAGPAAGPAAGCRSVFNARKAGAGRSMARLPSLRKQEDGEDMGIRGAAADPRARVRPGDRRVAQRTGSVGTRGVRFRAPPAVR